MGMSASQARYLGLVARMNNIEYQGQQINQERTILSQQCTALYNSLLDMQVPTPPSTSAYTKVVYTGLDGASSFTIGSVVPHNGTYSIDFVYEKTGHYVSEAGTAAATGAPAKLRLTPETEPITSVTTYVNLPTSSNARDLTNYTAPSSGVGSIMAFEGNGGSSFQAQYNFYEVPADVGIDHGAYQPSPQGTDTIMCYQGVPADGFTPDDDVTYYAKQNDKFVEVSDPTAPENKNKELYVIMKGADYQAASPADESKDCLLETAGTDLMAPKNNYGYYVIQGSRFVKIDNPTDAKYNNTEIYSLIDSNVFFGDGAHQHTDITKDYLVGTDSSIISPKEGLGYSKADLSNSYYVLENQSYRAVKDSDFATSTSDTTALFLLNNDGTYILNPNSGSGIEISKRSSAELVDENTTGTDIYLNQDKSDLIGIVADKNCYTLATAGALNLITEDSMVSYIEALRNAFPDYADQEEYSDADIKELFGVYFTKDSSTGRNVPHFVKTTEVLSSIGDVNDDHYLPTYDYVADGRYKATENKKNCLLTFDAQGRITEVKIPVSYAVDGSVATYKTVKLSAETTTDDAAYQEAYNDYEYAQYLYDKKQQEINAKTEIIQQEDRNLELKLTRLDNERKALDTEMDAVKKVIEDNIDASFKTFSG